MKDSSNIYWSVFRVGSWPVVEIFGESMDLNLESFAIINALEILVDASTFKGIVIPIKPKCKSKYNLCISFTVIFKNNEFLEDFLKYLSTAI